MSKIRFRSTREKDYFYYKRTWLDIGNACISTDFILGGKSCGISFGRGNRSLKFYLAIPFLFQLWFKIGSILKYKKAREFYFRIHSGSIWITLGGEPWEGKTYSFQVVERLKGKAQYSEETIEERDVLIPMPEGNYEGKARMFISTWKRPRWFTHTVKRVAIDIPKGIPHEGKGESSHDCGIDATYGVTFGECKSIPEAVGKLVGSVLKDRVKYGGWDDWKWHKERV